VGGKTATGGGRPPFFRFLVGGGDPVGGRYVRPPRPGIGCRRRPTQATSGAGGARAGGTTRGAAFVGRGLRGLGPFRGGGTGGGGARYPGGQVLRRGRGCLNPAHFRGGTRGKTKKKQKQRPLRGAQRGGFHKWGGGPPSGHFPRGRFSIGRGRAGGGPGGERGGRPGDPKGPGARGGVGEGGTYGPPSPKSPTLVGHRARVGGGPTRGSSVPRLLGHEHTGGEQTISVETKLGGLAGGSRGEKIKGGRSVGRLGSCFPLGVPMPRRGPHGGGACQKALVGRFVSGGWTPGGHERWAFRSGWETGHGN